MFLLCCAFKASWQVKSTCKTYMCCTWTHHYAHINRSYKEKSSLLTLNGYNCFLTTIAQDLSPLHHLRKLNPSNKGSALKGTNYPVFYTICNVMVYNFHIWHNHSGLRRCWMQCLERFLLLYTTRISWYTAPHSMRTKNMVMPIHLPSVNMNIVTVWNIFFLHFYSC